MINTQHLIEALRLYLFRGRPASAADRWCRAASGEGSPQIEFSTAVVFAANAADRPWGWLQAGCVVRTG
jgi:hypothetical protein